MAGFLVEKFTPYSTTHKYYLDLPFKQKLVRPWNIPIAYPSFWLIEQDLSISLLNNLQKNWLETMRIYVRRPLQFRPSEYLTMHYFGTPEHFVECRKGSSFANFVQVQLGIQLETCKNCSNTILPIAWTNNKKLQNVQTINTRRNNWSKILQ